MECYEMLRFKGGKIHPAIKSPIARFLWVYRHAQYSKERKSIFYFFWWIMYRHLKIRYGFELELETKVGRGLLIVHLGGIKVNPKAEIGENCTLFSGCVIGSIRGGNRAGAPRLGNEVYVGVNAAIVGGVMIGDDVVIAPNSFVNIDVPSHSVVFGNPARIIHKDNATEYYTFNKINFENEPTTI